MIASIHITGHCITPASWVSFQNFENALHSHCYSHHYHLIAYKSKNGILSYRLVEWPVLKTQFDIHQRTTHTSFQTIKRAVFNTTNHGYSGSYFKNW